MVNFYHRIVFFFLFFCFFVVFFFFFFFVFFFFLFFFFLLFFFGFCCCCCCFFFFFFFLFCYFVCLFVCLLLLLLFCCCCCCFVSFFFFFFFFFFCGGEGRLGSGERDYFSRKNMFVGGELIMPRQGHSFFFASGRLLDLDQYVKKYQNFPHSAWLWPFSYFHIFASAKPLSMKPHIWQVLWLDLVGIYQYAKNYQTIPNGLSAVIIFSNSPQTDRRTHKNDYRAIFESQTFKRSNRSAFRRVVQ